MRKNYLILYISRFKVIIGRNAIPLVQKVVTGRLFTLSNGGDERSYLHTVMNFYPMYAYFRYFFSL